MRDDKVEQFTHNGMTVQIVLDEDAEHANPRNDDGNVATLIQVNDRMIDVDTDDAGLGEAHDRFAVYHHRYDREAMVRRYIAMFRPDILFYTESWSAGGYSSESYGWGYVTRENWDRWMGEDYDGDFTPEQAFNQEVSVYSQWASGDVYGFIIYEGEVDEDNDITVDDLTEVDSCWGFIGEEWAIESAREAAGYSCKHCGDDIARNIGPVMDLPEGVDQRSAGWPWTHGRKMITRTVDARGRALRPGSTQFWNRRSGYVTDPDRATQYPADSAKRHLPLGGEWRWTGRYVKCLDGLHDAETDQPTGGKL